MRIRRMVYAIVFILFAMTTAGAQNFRLKIIALNDFHGNLQSPGKMRANAQAKAVPVGGADFLAGYVEHLKRQNPNNIVVSAGDVVGASPFVSSLFHDEGSIEIMNRMGLELTAVGNHEFDKGKQELLRKQNGGCSAQDENTCKGASVGTPFPFEGARFKFLAANVIDTSTGKTLFPAYAIKTYNGVKIAFIGLTLKETPTIVVSSGVAGLRFAKEATTINAIVKNLRRQGIKSFVVLLHQGGLQTKGALDINGCEGGLHESPLPSIVNKLDDAVDLVISAHTHQAYICELPNSSGRMIPVTSASAYGRVLTDIDVTINQRSRTITAIKAQNILVDRLSSDIKPDARIKDIVEKYTALAAPIINREVGSITADIVRKANASGESPLGDLIADAQLNATSTPETGGAVIAFMNDGGIRTDLPFISSSPGLQNGKVTYGKLFTTQPFGNTLITMNLTGSQIKTLLEEQFKGCALGFPPDDDTPPESDRWLEVSEGFTYTWSATGPLCHKVDADSIKIHGITVNPSSQYRVTVNNLLADGGDQFFVLKSGDERKTGPVDLDAMTAYFAKHPSVSPPELSRIIRKP